MAERKNTNESKVRVSLSILTALKERVFSLLNRKQFAEIQYLLTFLSLVPSCFILIILHVFIVAVRMCSHFRTVDNP